MSASSCLRFCSGEACILARQSAWQRRKRAYAAQSLPLSWRWGGVGEQSALPVVPCARPFDRGRRGACLISSVRCAPPSMRRRGHRRANRSPRASGASLHSLSCTRPHGTRWALDARYTAPHSSPSPHSLLERPRRGVGHRYRVTANHLFTGLSHRAGCLSSRRSRPSAVSRGGPPSVPTPCSCYRCASAASGRDTPLWRSSDLT